jgi:predicted ABC-type ATPase
VAGDDRPTCTIIAGPNGAGKTTFALRYLPEVAEHRRFVNADLIAAGLSPLAPEAELVQASRLFLDEIQAYIQRREDFAFETTLAGRGYLRLIQRLRAKGWRVVLVYLVLQNVAASEQRVAERVRFGGHNIPLTDIRRRFPRSLANLFVDYAPACDLVLCHDNTSDVPIPVFERSGGKLTVYDANRLAALGQKATQ